MEKFIIKNNLDKNSKIGIYRIVCVVDGKSYIGSSNNLRKRLVDHSTRLIKNTSKIKYLQESFNKYCQDNFLFEVIECVDEQFLGLRERELIVQYNTVYPNGFNGSLGGETGRRNQKLSQEEKEKISFRVSGEKNPNYGNRWSDEFRAEMSIKFKGRNKGIAKTEEHKAKISNSSVGKHNHHGLKNPNTKIDAKRFKKIKNDILKLFNKNVPIYKIEENLAEKYLIGSITIRRIIYGKHYLTEKFGCLQNWIKMQNLQ